MKRLASIVIVATLAGCGVETATTAATAGAARAKEAEEAKKTLDQMRERIDQSVQQSQSRAREAGKD
jgi:NifU-like protein involved in Fe-S cluster formation